MGLLSGKLKQPTRVPDEPKNLDETCGLEAVCFSRKPLPFLQCFATAKGALFFIGLGAVMQGFIVNGHTNVIISTLEKRFELSSTESGLIASCYDISACISILLVTYIGTRGHKPQWLGWGIFLMGIGGVVFSLPHFTAPVYTFTEESNTCGDPESAACQISTLKNFRFVFYFAFLIVGVGGTPLYSLGITYLDENVKQRYSAIYNGTLIACSILGPGIGFLTGASLLRIYVYPEQTVSITTSSEQWVGAWWIGALVSGIIALLVSLPVLMLPRQLPGTEECRKDRERDIHNNVVKSVTFGKRFRDFPKCLWILFRNPTFFFVGMGGAIDSLIINGLATFGPKYMETIFGLDASDAGIYFGLLAILGGVGGQLVGGGLITRFNISVRKMLHICYTAPAICVLLSACFLISCKDVPLAGITQAYNSSTSDVLNLTSSCNLNCSCSAEVYRPVCGSDRVVYYSSCFAGCQSHSGNMFLNCSCIPGAGNATATTCTETGCGSGGMFILFCFVIFLFVFFTFFNEAASLQISLRCVAFDQRSFGIGAQWLMIRLFGTIPGPLIMGALIDLACVSWSEQCGTRGSCLVYNSQKLSLYFFLFTCVIKFVDTLIFVTAKLTYKPKEQDPETSSNRHLNSVSEKSSTKERERNASLANGNDHVVQTQPEKGSLPGEITTPRTQESSFFENAAFNGSDGDA